MQFSDLTYLIKTGSVQRAANCSIKRYREEQSHSYIQFKQTVSFNKESFRKKLKQKGEEMGFGVGREHPSYRKRIQQDMMDCDRWDILYCKELCERRAEKALQGVEPPKD